MHQLHVSEGSPFGFKPAPQKATQAIVKSINGCKTNPPLHSGPPKPAHQLHVSEGSPFGFKPAPQPLLSSSCDLHKPLELCAPGEVNNKARPDLQQANTQAPCHYQQQDDNELEESGDNGNNAENEGNGGDRDHGRVDGRDEVMDGEEEGGVDVDVQGEDVDAQEAGQEDVDEQGNGDPYSSLDAEEQCEMEIDPYADGPQDMQIHFNINKLYGIGKATAF